MKRVILTVSVPKGQFVTIKKDGSIGYKLGGEGRRKVVGKIKRQRGFFYFVDHGKVYEADRASMLGRRAKRTTKKMSKKPGKGRVAGASRKSSKKKPAKRKGPSKSFWSREYGSGKRDVRTKRGRR